MSAPVTLHAGNNIAVTDSVQQGVIAFGATVPADNTPGFRKGCLFIKMEASSLDAALYINLGTSLLSSFQPIQSA